MIKTPENFAMFFVNRIKKEYVKGGWNVGLRFPVNLFHTLLLIVHAYIKRNCWSSCIFAAKTMNMKLWF